MYFDQSDVKRQSNLKLDAEQTLSEGNVRPGRKPLLLRGARQVGKTYLVETWARNHFESVVTVDLERERELHSLFVLSDTRRLLEELALLKGQPLVPGRCLLFLDEIQACPGAIAQLGRILQEEFGSATEAFGSGGTDGPSIF